MGSGKASVSSWAEWFERRARHYEDPLAKIAYYMDGKPLPYKLMLSTLRDVWKKLRAGKNTTLLDVGGGVGLFAKAFGPRLKDAITTDISFTMARDGKKINPKRRFFVCEAARLPFASSSFDRVLCYSVFHYFEGRRYAWRALDEFVRVAKDGAIVLVGDIPLTMKAGSAAGRLGRKQAKGVHYPASLRHNLNYTVFTPSEFAEYCASRGLPCRTLRQEISGKPTASSRFDVLIKVKK